ncbi:MAG: molybdenum cofactor biosynthesis F family protein [Oscillospiraceae bacterium]|jgi:hypothetical protein|nr:molybdenum cofactor biosynthesis F family protein [Oscillospiraceae bacterium]
MFRRVYTPLTGDAVKAAFAKVPAPTTTDSFSLAGRRVSFTTTDYSDYDFDFISERRFVTHGVEIEYAAKQLKHVILITYKIPGTTSTYTVIWDTKTDLVTIFEAWFDTSDEKYAREVKREIYYGWNKALDGKPETLHGLTNRLENKSIVWNYWTGERRLDVFNATFYSTFIVLSDAESGIPIAVPSDYIKIDEEFYIYSKMEAEFSGELFIEVIDLYSLRKIAMRLGFDENDKLNFGVHSAKGELAGQLATFTNFTDYGGSYDMNALPAAPGADAPPPKVKGSRAIYRFRFENPDFTIEEAKNSGKDPHSFPKAGIMLMPTGNSMPQSDFLAGKSFKLVEDEGFEIEYEITDVDALRWRTADHPEWQEETYRAFEAADNLYMFGHTQTGEDFGKTILAAVDFDNGLATLYHAKIGNKYSNREVGYEVKFGVIEIEGVAAHERMRHSFTTDMVGRAFTWNYSGGEQGITSMHTYTSPWGLSWTIFLANQEGGMMSSGPCKYIKLRDGEAYIMSWVEETAGGGLGTVLLNLRTMHDCGFMYGAMGEDKQIGLSTLGAYGRAAGRLDVLKYFEPRGE